MFRVAIKSVMRLIEQIRLLLRNVRTIEVCFLQSGPSKPYHRQPLNLHQGEHSCRLVVPRQISSNRWQVSFQVGPEPDLSWYQEVPLDRIAALISLVGTRNSNTCLLRHRQTLVGIDCVSQREHVNCRDFENENWFIIEVHRFHISTTRKKCSTLRDFALISSALNRFKSFNRRLKNSIRIRKQFSFESLSHDRVIKRRTARCTIDKFSNHFFRFLSSLFSTIMLIFSKRAVTMQQSSAHELFIHDESRSQYE
jgi:hypothetical protein